MDDSQIKHAEAELKRLDPGLGAAIENQKVSAYPKKPDYFASLCRSINSQQISVAAARVIFGRLIDVTDLNPERIVSLTDEQVKTIGLSRQKVSYIKDLAQHFIDDPAIFNHLDELDDEQVIKELTSIKGVGVWTAQMFLISSLGREDVFAPDDVGLQNAIIKMYKPKQKMTRSQYAKFAEKWQPYRTVASLHLWRYLDNNPN